MSLHQFVASSAEEAARQIREQLGPQAVVVRARRRPARWFRRAQWEVVARVPAESPTMTSGAAGGAASNGSKPGSEREAEPVRGRLPVGRGAGDVLEALGVMPVYAEQLRQRYGLVGGGGAEEVRRVRAALAQSWLECKPVRPERLHVLVGAPGVGKTTALCKWLTREVLGRGRRARVWRLDGATVNTGELLSLHAALLDVPVERSWREEPWEEEVGFVDLPGNTPPPAGLDATVHVVVHAAYEAPRLVEQVRAFPMAADVIVTHLDEEPRWGKLWNVVLGTGRPVRFLSVGQNLPGNFFEATAERVTRHVFAAG